MLAIAAVALLAPHGTTPALAQSAADPARLDALFWESVAESDDRAQFAAYLARFPNGLFADLARLKIAAIDRRTGVAPAPAAPPVASAPAPIVSTPVSAAPPAVPPPAAAVPAASPAGGDLSTMSTADLLSTAAGQALKPYAATSAVTQAIPPAPTLDPTPDLVFPAKFCSAQARNDYFGTTFTPAKELRDANNNKAIAHTQALQQVYDRFAADRDEPAMTMVSREATSYQAVAAAAFKESSTFAGRYTELMAVPIGNCD